MPNENSETLRQVFADLRHAEAQAGAQRRHAEARKSNYRFAAWMIVCVIAFTFGAFTVLYVLSQFAKIE